MTDKEYMQIAIDISKKSKHPYGAIVVKDNKIIGRSDSEKVKIDTCYTHAEFVAIQDALKENNLYGELKGATMYVSCEPCTMCMGAILYEEFDKIVYGAKLEDSNNYYCSEVLISSKYPLALKYSVKTLLYDSLKSISFVPWSSTTKTAVLP